MNIIQKTIDPAAAQAVDGTDMSAVVANRATAAEDATTTAAALDTASDALPETMYLPVYNGQVHPVAAANRQEITTLLQLGMKQRDFLPVYERLTRLADDAGAASVKAFVEQLYETEEEKRRVAARATFGDENGVRVYELERAQREQRYRELVSEQAARESRMQREQETTLEREFAALAREYPAYTAIEQVPDEVKTLAAVQRISLLDAHNRFVLAEQRRTAQAAAASKAAATESTGSLGGHSGETVSAQREAFLRGLYSRA